MPNHEPTVETPFRIVDKRGRQAFSFSTSRPSALHCGQVIPPTARNSHDPATYLIFNDENGDERGGTGGPAATAGLTVRARPDPDLSLHEAGAASRPATQVGWSSELGSCIMLHASTGNPPHRAERRWRRHAPHPGS